MSERERENGRERERDRERESESESDCVRQKAWIKKDVVHCGVSEEKASGEI